MIGHDISREEVLRMFPGATHAPIVVINDYNIGGASELQLLLESQTHKKLLLEG